MPLLPPTPTYAAGASLESPLTPWTPAVPSGTAPAGQQQQQQGLTAGQQAAAAQHAVQQQQQQQGGQAAGAAGIAQQHQQQQQAGPTAEQRELELQLYADFLRIVLEVRW